MTKNGDTEGYIPLLTASEIASAYIGQIPELGLHIISHQIRLVYLTLYLIPAPILASIPNPNLEVIKNYVTFCTNTFNIRQKSGPTNNNKDVFYHILGEGEDVKKRDTQLTQKQLIAETVLVISAVSLNNRSKPTVSLI
jgi:hypothetical protein